MSAFWRGAARGYVWSWRIAGPIGIVESVRLLDGWDMYAVLLLMVIGTWLAYQPEATNGE